MKMIAIQEVKGQTSAMFLLLDMEGTSASCTVSCREGYYACCTQVMYAVTCKCKKNVDTD